jgi:hypothetical protein
MWYNITDKAHYWVYRLLKPVIMGYCPCNFFRSPALVCHYSVYNVHAATLLWLVLIPYSCLRNICLCF